MRALYRGMRDKEHEPHRELAKLASRQYGVVAIWQLLGLGFSRDAVMRMGQAGRLHRLYRGVYAVGHRALSPRGKLLAAVYACGERAVASHHAAAWMWEVRRLGAGRLHVTVPVRRKEPTGIQLHCVRALPNEDRAVVEGIPVTCLARTLVDEGALLTQQQLRRTFEEADRRGLLDADAVARACHRGRGRKGVANARQALADYRPDPPKSRSDLEEDFLDFCRDNGIPEPSVNVWIAGQEVDMAWPEHGVIVELDSWEFHRTREAFERDRERLEELAAADLKPIRVTSRRMQRNGAALCAHLLALFKRHSAKDQTP